jgi:hypothetical protein
MSWSTSARLIRVEAPDLVDHEALLPDDECYYLLEYTARQSYLFGVANDLINNLKKDMKYRSRPEVWGYKGGAIKECGQPFGRALNAEWLEGATLVPIPPSKTKIHPKYDDRMLRVLGQIPAAFPLDIRELVYQRASTEAAHRSGGDRLGAAALVKLYEINEAVAAPPPVRIGVFDDVLTLGNLSSDEAGSAGSLPGRPGRWLLRGTAGSRDLGRQVRGLGAG